MILIYIIPIFLAKNSILQKKLIIHLFNNYIIII